MFRLVVKRVFDIGVGIILLVFFVPIILIVGILILVVDGWPIFFIQERPGLHCEPFNLVKFRTMRQQVGEPDELRVTPLGLILRKASLDEIPSLLNVIKGEMSIVGPRPLLMEYLNLYDDIQLRRHDVRPGVTGLAQINGRNHLDWSERFRLDLWYVRNYGFCVDVYIIIKTVEVVLRRQGINRSDGGFMTKFKGKK